MHIGAEFLLVHSQFAPDAGPVPTELAVKIKAAQMQNDAIHASQIRLVISQYSSVVRWRVEFMEICHAAFSSLRVSICLGLWMCISRLVEQCGANLAGWPVQKHRRKPLAWRKVPRLIKRETAAPWLPEALSLSGSVGYGRGNVPQFERLHCDT